MKESPGISKDNFKSSGLHENKFTEDLVTETRTNFNRLFNVGRIV